MSRSLSPPWVCESKSLAKQKTKRVVICIRQQNKGGVYLVCFLIIFPLNWPIKTCFPFPFLWCVKQMINQASDGYTICCDVPNAKIHSLSRNICMVSLMPALKFIAVRGCSRTYFLRIIIDYCLGLFQDTF